MDPTRTMTRAHRANLRIICALKALQNEHSNLALLLDDILSYPLPITQREDLNDFRTSDYIDNEVLDRVWENLSSRPDFNLSTKAADNGDHQDTQIKEDTMIKPINKVYPDVDSAVADEERATFVPHEKWQLYLLIDQREIRSKEDRWYIFNKLRELHISCEVRSLSLGDFLWIIRRRTSQTEDQHEYITDFIVERKTGSDLASSIVDGRYYEQKARLAECPCSRVFYVVEGSLSSRVSIGKDTLLSAMSSTEILSGFQVIQTENLDSTVAYLADMHHTIEEVIFGVDPATKTANSHCDTEQSFDNCTNELRGCIGIPQPPISFQEFHHASSKGRKQTLTEIFAKQLRQIPNMGEARTATLLSIFQTPNQLYDAMTQLDEEGACKLLANKTLAGSTQRFGPTMSRALHRYYNGIDEPKQHNLPKTRAIQSQKIKRATQSKRIKRS